MASRRKPQAGPSLFDVIEAEEKKEATGECQHPKEIFGETTWPDTGQRTMTATCVDCGRIRGRGGRAG